ncbi:TraX family protein [Pseudomonas aeruginosa]|uniref:TraX family protein n=1 Tax=Pseudomonas aeruginosa TaxID=287 RepID=UPI000B48E73B|nr:TraX family protein [Pseudomonas aeruginosa]OWI99111.1 conjugal transfer protein TraX [Pseudomonas aeruginosa]HEJ1237152.1 conjugal transfer protein TraX [Pseudomonas aeruginosa]
MNNLERNNSLDLIKWVALLSMIIDHAWYVTPSELQEPLRWMRTIGRLAFPLFCLAIAANVYRQPTGYTGGWRYLGGILLFALISQQPYSRFFEENYLNILFTLGLGLVITQAIHHRSPSLICAGIAALAIASAYRPILSFGLAGVLLPAALLTALHARELETKIVTWPLAALVAAVANAGANVLILGDLPPAAQAGISAAALAPLFGLLLMQAHIRTVTPVGVWMYPVYPIHLLLLSSLSIAWS